MTKPPRAAIFMEGKKMKLLSRHDTTDSSEKIKSILANIKNIVPIELKPGDVLVVEYDGWLRPEDREKISDQLSDCFGTKVQVLDKGMRIEAVLRR